jgi:hypothetical protein
LINPQFDAAYTLLEPTFVAGIAVVVILSTLMFFSPILSVHRLMKKEAAYFEAKLLRLADRISDFEELLLSKQAELEPEQLEDERAKVQAMRSVYSQQRRMPKWPIDVETHLKFIGTQAALLIAIISNIDTLYNLIVKVFT